MKHVFLLIGQSNMAGRGFINDVPKITNERIHMLRNGRWQMMAEPLNYDRSVAGVGLAGSFSEAWCVKNPEDSIALIPCAEGGSNIDEWAPDGLLFRHAVAQTRFAMENSTLSGILWHQGESDSVVGRTADYYAKLATVLDTFRTALDAPTLPLIIGGLPDFLGKTAFGLMCTEYQLINADLQKYADTHENTYFVTADELTANPDGIHIDALSQRRFGLRYFAAFEQKTNQLTPLKDETTPLNTFAERPLTQGEKMYLASEAMAMGTINYATFTSRLAEIYPR